MKQSEGGSSRFCFPFRVFSYLSAYFTNKAKRNKNNVILRHILLSRNIHS